MKKFKNIEVIEYQQFPVPEYWNWGWYKKFQKQKRNIVHIFRTFFKN